jgi:hypothetical protein
VGEKRKTITSGRYKWPEDKRDEFMNTIHDNSSEMYFFGMTDFM